MVNNTLLHLDGGINTWFLTATYHWGSYARSFILTKVQFSIHNGCHSGDLSKAAQSEWCKQSLNTKIEGQCQKELAYQIHVENYIVEIAYHPANEGP